MNRYQSETLVQRTGTPRAGGPLGGDKECGAVPNFELLHARFILSDVARIVVNIVYRSLKFRGTVATTVLPVNFVFEELEALEWVFMPLWAV